MSIRTPGILFAMSLMLILYAAGHNPQSSKVNDAIVTPPPSPWGSATATVNLSPTPLSDSLAHLLDISIEYRVAFLTDEEALDVRSGAGDGKTFEQIGSLSNGDLVQFTGVTQVVDGETWASIRHDGERVGWVQRNFLVGNLDRELFCDDPRIEALLASLQNALKNHDGQALAQLVSPRGLYMSFLGGRAVFIDPDEISGLFEDDRLRNWGNNGYRIDDLIGSMVDDVMPVLQADLLSRNLTVACNDNQDSLSITSVLYALRIDGYDIANFYSVMRPGKAGYELDWSAWGLAIEYWDRQPRLMGLAHYRWTP